MSTSSSRGILYVAVQSARYREEALISAASVKRKTGFRLPITIATDQPESPVIRAGRESGIFDEVVTADRWPACRIPWAHGQLVRIGQLRKTPYEHTLHLDTDTKIVGDRLETIFAEFSDSDIAMAEAEAQSSYSRLHFQRPLFNTGVILYRRSHRTDEWLESWWELSSRNFRLAQQRVLQLPTELSNFSADGEMLRRLLCMDQISLAATMYPGWNRFGLKVATLEPVWNHRGGCAPASEQTQILHERSGSDEAHAAELEAVLEAMAKLS
jgi:hypothetical protein